MSKNFKIQSDLEVELKFDSYPAEIKIKLEFLRTLIRQVAEESEEIIELQETLKWGEPSFIANSGSTLRMDWKEKNPDHYAMYFKCTSKLVETFKEVFGDTFEYEGKRAIIFHVDDEIPVDELKSCIKATLLYHKVKNHPSLKMR